MKPNPDIIEVPEGDSGQVRIISEDPNGKLKMEVLIVPDTKNGLTVVGSEEKLTTKQVEEVFEICAEKDAEISVWWRGDIVSGCIKLFDADRVKSINATKSIVKTTKEIYKAFFGEESHESIDSWPDKAFMPQ